MCYYLNVHFQGQTVNCTYWKVSYFHHNNLFSNIHSTKESSFYSFIAQVSEFDGLNIMRFSLKPDSLVGEKFSMFNAQFHYQTHRLKLIIIYTDNAIEIYHIFTPIHVNIRFIASSRKPITKSL